MSNQLTEFLTYRVLSHKFMGHGLLDQLADDDHPDLPLKNMCAKVPADFDQKVSDLSEFLDIRKAEFIRRAVHSAMVEAERIMKIHLDQEEVDEEPQFVSDRETAA